MNRTTRPLRTRLKVTLITGLILILPLIYFFSQSQPTMGQSDLDQFGFLPYIKNDPTPTATPTLTSTPEVTVIQSSTPACTPPNTIDSSDVGEEEEMLIAINDVRDDNNRSQLIRAEELVQGARKHSLDMMENGFVDNRGSNGDYGPDRIREQCYFLAEDQEIVWRGRIDTAADLVNSWLENPNWRSAMLDSDMEDFGAGYILDTSEGVETDDIAYLTVSFARREVAATATPTPTSTPRTVTNSATPPGSIQTASVCALHIENEYGSGSLFLRDEVLCTKALRGYQR